MNNDKIIKINGKLYPSDKVPVTNKEKDVELIIEFKTEEIIHITDYKTGIKTVFCFSLENQQLRKLNNQKRWVAASEREKYLIYKSYKLLTTNDKKREEEILNSDLVNLNLSRFPQFELPTKYLKYSKKEEIRAEKQPEVINSELSIDQIIRFENGKIVLNGKAFSIVHGEDIYNITLELLKCLKEYNKIRVNKNDFEIVESTNQLEEDIIEFDHLNKEDYERISFIVNRLLNAIAVIKPFDSNNLGSLFDLNDHKQKLALANKLIHLIDSKEKFFIEFLNNYITLIEDKPVLNKNDFEDYYHKR